MNTPMRPPTPRHVPTLTEVIEVDSLLEPAGQVVPEPEHVQTFGTTAEPVFVPPSVPVPVPVPVPVSAMVPEPQAPASTPAPAPVAVPAAVPPASANLHDAPIPRSMLIDRSAWASSTMPGDFSAPEPATVSAQLRAAALPTSPGLPGARTAAAPAVDEALITQRVMADLQRQIDGMLEYRLRETLAPILARTTEALVRELRQELSKTMKDVVARSVAQEVARQRSRG